MSFAEFREALAAGAQPPPGLSLPVLALWHDARGDWDAAHTAAQQENGRDGAWVHAYLHRKEGDRGNAGYWYARAAKPTPPASASLEEEWAQIAQALLGK